MRDHREWVNPDEQWGTRIQLDRNRIVRVTLPEEYPGKRLARVKRELAAIPLLTAPDWFMEQVAGGSSEGPAFDVTEAGRTDRLAVLKAALPIGWPAREMLLATDRNVNDYYLYLRELRFLHFLASLRARAERALRDVLMVARGCSDISLEVIAHDLCTTADISDYIRQFEDGDLSFSEVKDIIFQEPGLAKVARRRVA